MESAGVTLTARSAIWETEPVPANQPAFLNAVVRGETTLDATALLAAAKRIERRLGRRPERHWGPRPVDIDILFHGDSAIQTDALTIPHPRIPERAFVLAPLAEVFPGALPAIGVSALHLLGACPPAAVRRTGIAW
jgi:2-amino-4-hydroxy-6-hydroxymethyldihydropteridine diphosphokinase